MTKEDTILEAPNFGWGLRFTLFSKNVPAVQSNQTVEYSHEALWLYLTKLHNNIIYIYLLVIKYFWDIGYNNS